MERDRAAILSDLVAFRRPVAVLAVELESFDWDSDFHLVQLARTDVRSVLESYLRGELEAESCHAWAHFIWGREDIALEAGREAELFQMLFLMAEPEVNGSMTPGRAAEWIGDLDR